MVNYCSVYGCLHNSRINKHLNFFTLPKERERQIQWLSAAKREDLLSKDPEKLCSSYRFCSSHFPAPAIKNRYLSVDAIPTLHLPKSKNETTLKNYSIKNESAEHVGIACDSCNEVIEGFRYKCVTCPDYDLCMKCEMRSTHDNHYMIRIPKPLKFKIADKLIEKWREFFNVEHVTVDEEYSIEKTNYSSDDEPITKYITNKEEIHLSGDIKARIRNEVSRMLSSNCVEIVETRNKLLTKSQEISRSRSTRRKAPVNNESETQIKKSKIEEVDDADGVESFLNEVKNKHKPQELAFAEVIALKDDEEIKNETHGNSEQTYSSHTDHMVEIKLSDDLTDLIIEVAGAT